MANILGLKNQRFGNLPLPVEEASSAADGELMISRTTGHVYVKNGSKIVSKTVEIEEFLKNYRSGAVNWIRNGGDFEPELASKDWTIQNNKIGIDSSKMSYGTDVTIDKKYINFKFPEDGSYSWYYASNRMYTYDNLKDLKIGDKLCLSIIAKCAKNDGANVQLHIADGNESNNVIDFGTLTLTTEWKKYEFVAEVTGRPNQPMLRFKFPLNQYFNNELHILAVQLEPGDRSTAWRPSWLDLIQRMNWLDSKIAGDINNKIQQAITHCKSYTDGEVTKLTNLVKQWLNDYLQNSKNYTDGEITKVNNNINNKVNYLNKVSDDTRAHIILGNSDWTHLLSSVDGCTSVYNEDEKGIVITTHPKGSSKVKFLTLFFPVNQYSKYYVQVKARRLAGDGLFYCGVESSDKNKQPLNTDNATSFNYGVCSSVALTDKLQTFSGIFQGYNPKAPDINVTHKRFDPYAAYFKVMMICNYNATVENSSSIIEGLEVFEIPLCLEDAISPVNAAKNGLMTTSQFNKLEGIEDRANRYVHPDNDGYRHVPATGSSNKGKVLTAGNAPGVFSWEYVTSDSHTLDGKQASDFVWVNEETKQTNMTGKTIKRNNKLALNAISWDAKKRGSLIIETPNTVDHQYFILKLSLYDYVKGACTIELGGYMSAIDNTMYNVSAFCSNKKYGDTISFFRENGRTKIKLGNSSTLWEKLFVSVDSYIIGWENTSTDLKLRNEWAFDIIENKDITNLKPKEIYFNENLNSSYLDGRPSTDFANMYGEQSTDYTRQADANISARNDNKDSWLFQEITGTANGMYYRNTNSDLSVAGNDVLPKKSLAMIGNGKLSHYYNLENGNAYHRGKLEASNIQLGNYRIIADNTNKCLDFVFE